MTDAPESELVLVNPAGARLRMDPGSGDLLALEHPSGARLTAARSATAVVRLRVGDRVATLASSAAGRVQAIHTEDGIMITFSEWPDHELTIVARVRPTASGFAWTAGLQVGPAATVEWLQVPSIIVPSDLTGPSGTGRIVWPWCEGVLVDSLDRRDNGPFARDEPAYPSRALDSVFPSAVCAQFIAHLGADRGLLLAAHDPAATPKEIDYVGADGGIELLVRTYAAGATGTYDLGFEVETTVVEGGWQDLAGHYRQWFESVTDLPAVGDRTDLPEWYLDSPLVVTYPVRGWRDQGDLSPNRLLDRKSVV